MMKLTFRQCRRNGNAQHHFLELWKCNYKKECEGKFDYAGKVFCKEPIREEIMKDKAKQP